MKTLFFLVNFVVRLFAFSQTQTELNKNSKERLLNAQEELEQIIQNLNNKYSQDTAFIFAFNNSQKLWKELSVAELRMKYPKREPGYYGSNHSMCINLYLTELTIKRTGYLSPWLIGGEEGDACAGTLKD